MPRLVTPIQARRASEWILTVALLSCASSTLAAEPLFPNSDFELGTLENWQTEGDAFTKQPTAGDNPVARNRESAFYQGDFWIGGFEARTKSTGKPGDIYTDDVTGTLTSQPFTIKHNFISFLVGGGKIPDNLGVSLDCDGETIELATGGDSETMRRVNADVTRLKGREARIVVYDRAVGQWGHINVDDFVGSDTKLADESQGFALTRGIPADAYPAIDYSEKLRPQFHFSSGKNWLNDPNGMVFDGTQYHLFFQHNPLSPDWGNMTWGHATSPDMVHWKQAPHALLPYRVDGQVGTIFSGTAVVDHNNSLGVQVGNVPTLCAFFTFATTPKFYQAMAYSTDRGQTWKYWNEGRAVIENQGFDSGERDPKVFWHEESKQWVMALWVQQNPGRVRIFVSKNLKDWQHASDLMRDWAFECMDVVFLPLDGDEKKTKAVIYDASFDYEVGTFDGKEFHTQAGPFVAGGGNFYAAQTFSNSSDGRVVQIGWMRGGPNWARAYDLPANQQMSFPCQLTLKLVDGEPRLFAWPIKEIDSLVTASKSLKNINASEAKPYQLPVGSDLLDVSVEVVVEKAKTLTFEIGAATLHYDVAKQTLKLDGVNDQGDASEVTVFENLPAQAGVLKLRFLVDRLSVETYAFGGERFHADYIKPASEKRSLTIGATGGAATVHALEVHELSSAWKPAK